MLNQSPPELNPQKPTNGTQVLTSADNEWACMGLTLRSYTLLRNAVIAAYKINKNKQVKYMTLY